MQSPVQLEQSRRCDRPEAAIEKPPSRMAPGAEDARCRPTISTILSAFSIGTLPGAQMGRIEPYRITV